MSAPFAPIQSTTKQTGSVASVTTTAMTTSASGSLFVVVIISFANTIGATPVTDNKSNTWVNAVGPTGTTNGFAAIYYCANGTGGAGHTFTFTPSSSDFLAISVLEIGGAATSSTLNQTNGAVANSTTHSTSSITSGTTQEVFVGGGSISSGASGTPVLNKTLWYGMSALPDGALEGVITAFRFVDAGVSDFFSFTTSSARNEGVVIAGFKSASTGAASTGGSYTFFGA